MGNDERKSFEQLSRPVSPEEAEAAFDATRALREALTTEQAKPKALDPAKTAGLVLSVVPRLVELAPEEDTQVVGFNKTRVAELRTLSAAVLHAHAACHLPKDGQRAELVGQATALKNRFFILLDALPHWGVLTFEDVLALPRERGDLATATSLLRIAELLKEKREVIAGNAPIKESDRVEASRLGLALMQFVNRRTAAEIARRTVLTGDLHRAMAVLVDRYGELQVTLRFTRRTEKDADQIAPSLFNFSRGKPRRRKSAASEAQPEKTPPRAPAAPEKAPEKAPETTP